MEALPPEVKLGCAEIISRRRGCADDGEYRSEVHPGSGAIAHHTVK